MNQEETKNGKATVVITYNSVNGYPAGTYYGKNGHIIVYSNEAKEGKMQEQAESKLSEVLHGLYGNINPENVKQVYLYVGKYAMNGALSAASAISGNKNKVILVACKCDGYYKQEIADNLGLKLIWSECQGKYTLESIVKKELG